MGNETLIIAILGILLGLGVGYILFFRTKMMNKLTKRLQKDIINDPRKLKELLEKNGTFVDDGKEISYKIDVVNGKEILVKETKEIPQPKKQKEAKPKKKEKPKTKTKTTKKPKK